MMQPDKITIHKSMFMIEMPSNNNSCDGTVPDDWEMPELGSRAVFRETYIAIDFRGLSSPAPLVGTLKALEKLSEHMHFEGHYPQAPIHLFPALVEEGWQWEVIEETSDGMRLKIFGKGISS